MQAGVEICAWKNKESRVHTSQDYYSQKASGHNSSQIVIGGSIIKPHEEDGAVSFLEN